MFYEIDNQYRSSVISHLFDFGGYNVCLYDLYYPSHRDRNFSHYRRRSDPDRKISLQLPAFLPEELHFASRASSEEVLFTLLAGQTARLIEFFEYACDDEMWCEKHTTFITRTINALGDAYLREGLSERFALRAVRAMQKHFYGINIPWDLLVRVEGQDFDMNCLMVKVCSDVLFYRVQGRKVIDIPLNHFLLYKQFIETGDSDLWKCSLSELLALRAEAKAWHIRGFEDCCAVTMKRYLTRDNALDLLIMSHDEEWGSLKNECIDFLNQQEAGVLFRKYGVDDLAFEFLEFSHFSWHLFDKLKSRITHLITAITDEPDFGAALEQCPKLFSVDVTLSKGDSPFFAAIPARVQELNLSMCSWLDERTIKAFPAGIKILKLRSDTHLKFTFWQALLRFNALESLDISRCQQVGDAELRLIASALPHLKELYLQECPNLSQIGFLAWQCPKLEVLNVGRTDVDDQALLELSSLPLVELYVVRCERVTERGISETLRLGSNLIKVDLTRCSFSLSFVQELRRDFPQVEIVF